MRNSLLLAWFLWLFALPMWAQEDLTNEEPDSLVAETLLADTLAQDTIKLEWPLGLRERLGRMVTEQMFETSQVALMVYDLTADSLLFGHNARQLMRPASIMKVITAVAAIDQLGGSHLFKTSLRYTGSIDNGTLNGSVYLVGGFDPRFNGDDMTAFAESMKKMGIDTIRGSIMADKSMKDAKHWGEGWCWDDDNPTLSPLLVNRKDRFMEVFLQKLQQTGIVLDASTGEERAPSYAYEICSRFHSLDQVLYRMMKESDNLYAEAMFYQMGTAGGTQTSTAKTVTNVIKRLIAKNGLQPSDYRIADGSGLSLYNYVTAELQLYFLRYAYKNENIFNHLYYSLPIAGMDGTLKGRMKGTFASGNVRAKTGSVASVSSLAGYCTAANGHKLAFVIINNGLRTTGKARSFQNRVCNLLCSPQ